MYSNAWLIVNKMWTSVIRAHFYQSKFTDWLHCITTRQTRRWLTTAVDRERERERERVYFSITLQHNIYYQQNWRRATSLPEKAKAHRAGHPHRERGLCRVVCPSTEFFLNFWFKMGHFFFETFSRSDKRGPLNTRPVLAEPLRARVGDLEWVVDVVGVRVAENGAAGERGDEQELGQRQYQHLHLRPDNRTRGHNLKLIKQRCSVDATEYYFTNRVVNIWNSLPSHTVSSPTLSTFKSRLLKHDFTSRLMVFTV